MPHWSLRLAYNRHGPTTGSRRRKTAEVELLMGVHVVSEFDHMTITMGMACKCTISKISHTAGDGRPVGRGSRSVSSGGRRQSAPCTPARDYRLPHSHLSHTDQVSFRGLHRPGSVGQHHRARPPQAQGSRKRHSVRYITACVVQWPYINRWVNLLASDIIFNKIMALNFNRLSLLFISAG